MLLTSTLIFPHFSCQVHTNYGTPEAWKSLVPSSGVLSFDYVSGVTPPADAVSVGDAQVGGGGGSRSSYLLPADPGMHT